MAPSSSDRDARRGRVGVTTAIVAAVAICSSALIVSGAEAASSTRRVSLLRAAGPLAPSLYFSPVKHDGSLDGPVTAGGPATIPDTADWYVAQWNNPSPFTAANLPAHGEVPVSSACNSSMGDFGLRLDPVWSVESANARVCALRDPSGNATTYVQLAASGGDSLACSTEFDMFLSPVGSAYPRYKPANMDPGADGWSLNTTSDGGVVTAITLAVDMSSDYVHVGRRCGSGDECGNPLDYGYITIGLPIHNNVSREQNFFQVQIFDSRQGVCPGVNPCSTDDSIGWYFRTLPVLGSNVAIGSFPGGATCLRPGGAARYSLDVLPVLKRVVAEGARLFGADANLDHWFVNGLYVGQGLQGATTMTTTVGNIRLEAVIEGGGDRSVAP